MKTDMKYAVAVLVDGDNASFENLEDVMGFVSRHGNAIIRRIYGDWTRKPLSGWKDAPENTVSAGTGLFLCLREKHHGHRPGHRRDGYSA